ncbi:hypothetical protein MTR67_051518 [Solanum verrucosum]|uniref:Gag-pol polyprotein n=1 Tax=Solanum verrucosum TaxID=315347 RepID=A0AAF0V3F8_SOLVR|nr:hypothetical protein MTR67_051518 [Solanum verrucosum]
MPWTFELRAPNSITVASRTTRGTTACGAPRGNALGMGICLAPSGYENEMKAFTSVSPAFQWFPFTLVSSGSQNNYLMRWKPFTSAVQEMKTRRVNARRAEKENVNQGVHQGNQTPQANQAPVDPPAMMDVEIRLALLILTQAMTVQAQVVTTQAQAMTAQANRATGPHVNTVDSRLRDFTRMNPPVFLGSKVGEDPQEFMEEVYKIIDAMGVTSVEKAELAAY